MTSDRTKVTPRPHTKNLSKNIVPASSTEKLSQALKSTFKSLYQAHQKGYDCESRVARELARKNFELLAARWKTPFAELDLVFKKNKTIYVVEVKSLMRLDFGPARVKNSQKARLLRAREWLQSKYDRDVALAFAYVLGDGEILLLDSEGDELTS